MNLTSGEFQGEMRRLKQSCSAHLTIVRNGGLFASLRGLDNEIIWKKIQQVSRMVGSAKSFY